MSFIANISFLDVCTALVLVAVAERLIMQYAPDELVGPDGWLLKTDS